MCRFINHTRILSKCKNLSNGTRFPVVGSWCDGLKAQVGDPLCQPEHLARKAVNKRRSGVCIAYA